MTITDNPHHPARPTPDGWVEISENEYTQLRAAGREAGEAASAALLVAAQQAKVDALVAAGLTPDQAAAIVGEVPTGHA